MATNSNIDATSIIHLAEHDVVQRARELYSKLGQTMTFMDRDRGFDEWDNLGDALKALNNARSRSVVHS